MRVNCSLIKLEYMFLAMLRLSNNGTNNVPFFGLSFVQFGHDLVKLPVKRFDVGLRRTGYEANRDYNGHLSLRMGNKTHLKCKY